jgi:hypothetical protein
MYRIYFDSNNAADDGYSLSCVGSQADIVLIADQLQEGMHVILYITGELEMEAVLNYDAQKIRWIGCPVPGTLRYLDGGQAD